MLWYLKNCDSETVYEISGEVTFGRTEGDHQFPQLPLMSRVHLKIGSENHSPWLVDLGSRNGTFLNYQKIAPQEKVMLKDEDLIAFGGMKLIFKKKVVLSTSLTRYSYKKRGA